MQLEFQSHVNHPISDGILVENLASLLNESRSAHPAKFMNLNIEK